MTETFTRVFVTVSGVLAFAGRLYSQSPPILSGNTSELNVQMSLDQTNYLLGEAATLTITVTNPTSSSLQVMQPFSAKTGCLAVYGNPAGGPTAPLGTDSSCNPFTDPGGLAVATPTIVMTPGQQVQTTLASYGPMFDGASPAIEMPNRPGSYLVAYLAYKGVAAPFSIEVPTVDTSNTVPLGSVSYIDPTTGNTAQAAYYAQLLALRSNGVSYICVSALPTASTTVSVDSNGNLSGNPGPFRRIASSANQVVSLSGTTDGAGNITVQWQDSMGGMFTANFSLQYHLSADVEPDGAGSVLPGSSIAAPGASIILTAVPNPGYSFVNWTGAPVINPGSATTLITMNSGYAVTANFVSNGQTGATNISSQFSATTSAPSFNSAAGLYLESVTLTNTSGQYIGSPISLVLTNLSQGFMLENATGTYNGNPYIRVLNEGMIAPGQSVQSFLQFSVGPSALVRFTSLVYSGL